MVLRTVAILILLPLSLHAADKRSYTGGRFMLGLDKAAVGIVTSDDIGGTATGVVVSDPSGGEHLVKKHISNVKWVDIPISMGLGMSNDFYQWIADSFSDKANASRKSGSVIYLDRKDSDPADFEFTNGYVAELGMPALDAASKDAAKMSIKVKPEYSRRQDQFGHANGGKTLPAVNDNGWQVGDFRLKIDGLEGATARVNKIDGFTIKQSFVDKAGEVDGYEVSDLAITFPDTASKPFYDWLEDFVVKGNNSDKAERGGTLEYLARDGKTVLFTLTFKGLGIFKLSQDKQEAGSDTLRRIKAEMYCESVTFGFNPIAATYAWKAVGKRGGRGIASGRQSH